MASHEGPSNRRQSLPPHQVDCVWWKKGYCFRGTKCFFRHDAALAGVDKDKEHTAQTNTSSIAEASPMNSATSPSSADPAPSASRESCAICLETPVTYGLLVHCDHVFCLECIRNWRSSSKLENPVDLEFVVDPAAVSKNTKTCPLCRTKSDFVIPSSVFPTPPTVDAKSDRENSGPSQAPDNEAAEEKQNPVKEQIIQGYLAKLKKIPCRYFEDEVKRWREKVARAEARNGGSASSTRPPKFVPKCSFANKCHYAHLDPITKEPYVFSASEIRDMKRRRHEQRARELRDRWFNNIPPGPHLEFVTRSFEEISFDPCPGSPDEQDFHFALAVATLDRELFSYTLPAVDSDHDDDYGDYYYEDYGYGGISEPESPRERPTEWLPDWEHERRYGWGVLEDAYL